MDAQAWDRIAGDYLGHIVSPFDRGISNPLFDQLLAIRCAHRKTVADLGCGVGMLLPFLSKRFRKVAAIDFSAGMLRRARRKVRATNVSFRRADMTDLSRFRERFHVTAVLEGGNHVTIDIALHGPGRELAEPQLLRGHGVSAQL